MDRCAGSRLATWLRNEGHDVLEARTLGPDPGDEVLLEIAESSNRIMVTLDTDFGTLIFLRGSAHAGLIRLPDVPSERRIALVAAVIERHRHDLENRAIITVREDRINVSHSSR